MKRFSIGEAVLIVGGVAASISLLVAIPLLGTGVATIGAVAGSTSLAILMGTVVLSSGWSYRCFPGLPYELADDLAWFASRTLFAPCDFLLSGVYGSAYTAETCAVCDSYSNGDLTAAWCTDELGFDDVIRNLVFFANATSPDILTWLNTTQVIVLKDVADWAREAGYLDAFADVDMTDPGTFAQYWTCATSRTLLPNLIIAAVYLIFAFYVLRPIVGLFFGISRKLFWPAALATFQLFTLNQMLLELPATVGDAAFEATARAARATGVAPLGMPVHRLAARDAVQRAALPRMGRPTTALGAAINRRVEGPAVRLMMRAQRRLAALRQRLDNRRGNDAQEMMRMLPGE